MGTMALAFEVLAKDSASKPLRNIGDEAERTGRKVGDAGDNGGKRLGSGIGAGVKIAAGALAGLGAIRVFSGFIQEAAESAKIGRLTDAVIKSTGAAAKISSTQVNALAGAISNKTAVDDEAIQSGANLLLTFTKVRNETGKGNDIFNQATQAAVDMSVALGTDVSGASLQLGKALNDPIKGVTALSKAGVSFTQQQKDQIKAMVAAGDTLGAQKIILGEMQVQFGGAAEAAASPLDRLKVVAGNLGESVGGLLLPMIERFATFVSDRVVPAVDGFVTGMREGTGAGGGFADKMSALREKAAQAFDYFQSNVLPRLREFAGFLRDSVLPMVGNLADFIKRNSDFFIPFVATIGTLIAALKVWTIVQGVLNAVLLANPVGLVVIAIAALVAGLVVAYQKSETFRAIVDGAFRAVAAAASFMWNDVLKPTFRFVVDAFLGLAGAIVDGAAKAFGWVPGIGPKLKEAAANFNTFRDDVNRSLNGIQDKTVNVSLAFTGAAEVNNAIKEKAAARKMGDGPGAGGPMLARVSQMIAGTGLSVSSTYRTPARNAAVGGSPSSYHLDRGNPAVDVVGPSGALDGLASKLRANGGLRELLWKVPGHFDHLHVAHTGGQVSQSWPRMPGDKTDERTARLRVGEVVTPANAGVGGPLELGDSSLMRLADLILGGARMVTTAGLTDFSERVALGSVTA